MEIQEKSLHSKIQVGNFEPKKKKKEKKVDKKEMLQKQLQADIEVKYQV